MAYFCAILKRRVRSFGVIRIRICDPISLGSWCIKGTDESVIRVDSSVPLMHHDPSDLGSLLRIRSPIMNAPVDSIPWGHPVGSSRGVIPWGHPVGSSRGVIPWGHPVVHLEKLGPVPGEEVGKLLEFGVSFLEFGVSF